MIEEWRKVIDSSGFYEVSSTGRVRSLDMPMCTLGGVKWIKSGRILSLSPNSDGYLAIKVPKTRRVHRLVAIAFIPNPDNKPEVNHIDGNKQNNHVDNLEWVTRVEQIRHAYSTGLKSNVGVKNPSAKLTEADVRIIREAVKHKFSMYSIAKYYKVSNPTIRALIHGKSWSHIK